MNYINHKVLDTAVALPDGAMRLYFGAIVDAADLSRVAELSGWYVPGSGGWKGYAVSTNNASGRKRTVSLHRWLLTEPIGQLVDHIDGDILNNRRANLRLTDKRGNGHNMRKSSNQKRGGFKGVFPSGKSYRAQIGITVDGKLQQLHLGCFATAVEAARAYDAAALTLFGAFAAPNFNYSK